MRKLTVTDLIRHTPDTLATVSRTPITVILDNIRSHHNVGSIFRTCDAFLIERLILCGITTPPPSAEIHKTALGAEFTVPWTYFPGTLDAIDALRRERFHIISLEQTTHSIPLERFTPPPSPIAVILGNEVHGVSQSVLDSSDTILDIPQYGVKHSLNVSVAAGIVIWNLFHAIPSPVTP
ncbi:MAG: RNA methyltransferase [Dysgonamonadaceae bacterium]|jgi:tRNA G18 (ribose-2'-O)-methylase SpoU|nr:RNA methyltransferase [Dysgonamonadaceae bacterium]